MKQILKSAIWFYQAAISGFLGQRCRFYPSCSHYMAEALDKHGVVAGTTMGVRRICRCHPFSDGGYDPVPEEHSRSLAELS